MPRPLPLFGDEFDEGWRGLLRFAERVEANHFELKAPRSGLKQAGVEMTYELLFLKVFLLWEKFQQDVFVRLLMGFQSNGGSETLLPHIGRPRTLADAENAVLSGRRYRLWHDPVQVMRRSDQFFEPASSYFRNVIGANQAMLENAAAIRHQIAHAQSHARVEFDAATMSMSGRRFQGQAGRFLRTERTAGLRWIESICREFSDVAHQLC